MAKKLTLAPIVGHLEETKPFARASKAVYQPGAGPVDEKSNSSLSEMAIQPLRASSKKNRHHNSTGQHGIHIVWKSHLFHSTGCIASPACGRVWLTCHTVFVSLPKNHGEHTSCVLHMECS